MKLNNTQMMNMMMSMQGNNLTVIVVSLFGRM